MKQSRLRNRAALVSMALTAAFPTLSCNSASESDTYFFVLSEVAIIMDADAPVTGVDIDGVDGASPSDDCPRDDLPGGIDNAAAAGGVIRRLDTFLGSLNDPLQANVRSGNFTLLFELRGVQSLENDDSVEVTVMLGDGDIETGPGGAAVPYQTFVESDQIEPLVGTGSIRDGVLRIAIDGVLPIPLTINQAEGRVSLSRLVAEVAVEADGQGARGVLGAVAGIPSIQDLLIDGAQEGLVPLATGLLASEAEYDLDPVTQRCLGFSMGVEIALLPAFITAWPDSQLDPSVPEGD